MASALNDELEMLAVEVERSTMEEVVGTLWAALEVGDGPQARGLETLLFKVGAIGREGRRDRRQGRMGKDRTKRRDN